MMVVIIGLATAFGIIIGGAVAIWAFNGAISDAVRRSL